MKKIDWNIQGAYLLVVIICATSLLDADEITPADDSLPAIEPRTEEVEGESGETIPKEPSPDSETVSEEETPNPAHVQFSKKNYFVPRYIERNILTQKPVAIVNPFVVSTKSLEPGQKIKAVEIFVLRVNGETVALFDTVIAVLDVTWSPQGEITKLILSGDEELQKQLARVPQESLQFRVVGVDLENGVIPAPEHQVATDAESLLKWALTVRRQQAGGDVGDVMLSPEDSRSLLIDPEKLELHENYILNPYPLDSPGWRNSFEALQSVGEGTRRSKLLRVFLEDPQPEERITLQGQKSIKMFYRSPTGASSPIQAAPRNKNSKTFHRIYPGDSSTADGTYHEIYPGQFSGFTYFSRAAGSLKIASPYHLPAIIELPPPEEEVGALGEVMLLRPKWHELSTMLVTLTDADGQPVKDWHFSYGPITFGGPYGYTKTLSNQGMAIVEGLAPQSFQVGFSEKPLAKFRSSIELKPGHLTRIAFRLDANGELLEPNVSQYPWNDVPEDEVTEAAAEAE
ncbi:hypothetical protein [Rubinisphaera italica]|uniref:Uncharacterized protein n=1 Tax=Rubinisphaera italica TaxID=2527969 RepID=A0A5C5X9W4_9PLAN|nr:hypothetical protein [Rubinisphaera italica]TWT59568.1 hypothetical protein Pan54_02750 [Rubinisphaera italica]